MRRFAPLMASIVLVTAGLSPSAHAASNDPHFSNQWALPLIGAPEAWTNGDGRGITIAIVDSGVDLDHEDLREQLVPGYDFVRRDTPPQDENGHGTHVAGIAAARTNNHRGVASVAPQARIMPVRVLDDEGAGSGSNVAAGVRWAVDNGAHVVNLSLATVGGEVFGPSFGQAIEYAWSKGAIPVVAAGNSFFLWSGYSNASAIVVSAVDRNDRKPPYSNGVQDARWGMAAPGGGGALFSSGQDGVLSTYWRPGQKNLYAYLSGTSMAAPHVSGAAAVLRGMGISPQRTVEILLGTAKDIGSQRDFGHGRLDAAAAVNQGLTDLGRQPSGEPQAQPAPVPQTGQQPPPTQARRQGPGARTAGVSEQEDPSEPGGEEPEATGPAPTTPATPPVAALGDRQEENTRLPVAVAALALLLVAGAAWSFHLVRRRSP